MEASATESPVGRGSRNRQLLSAQLRLVYTNANLGIAVNLTAASILCGLEWRIAPRATVILWWLYIAGVAGLRFWLSRLYLKSASPVGRKDPEEDPEKNLEKWRRTFALGAGLAGLGWGAAGVLLYAPGDLANQVMLFFVLGGMMLGASSLLAPLTRGFVAFLIPAGVIPAVRLLFDGGRTHANMGLLASMFTAVLLITTRRMHRTILSSLRLQFEKQDLIQELRTANQETVALNQELEERVQARTAELHRSTEQLRAEIMQRQQAEEELLRARKLESLGVLAGGIAHDFNNFLTVVQGNIDLARVKIPDMSAHEFLEQATHGCQRAKQLSTQLLTFAKGGSPIRRLVSVAQLVTDAVQMARTQSPVGIDMKIADGLWSAEVDPGQIGQVLHNILINAQEAMPAGTAIEVRARNVARSKSQNKSIDPKVRVSIRDHGSGIPPEVLRRIFDPYFTTKPGGTGLGLATAYAIVVKHGGHISAQSSPEGGTEFTVDLPASDELPPDTTPTTHVMHRGRGRLLIMDDDPSLRVLFQAVLAQLGYEVRAAADGVEAIELYRSAKETGSGFDAVVLDLTVVEGMGGVEAAARLKALDPAIRMVVSSGYSDAPVMSQYAEYGFDAVIEKPWTVQEMSQVLRSVLTAEKSPRA